MQQTSVFQGINSNIRLQVRSESSCFSFLSLTYLLTIGVEGYIVALDHIS
jgi:hypothetical protein